MDEQEQKEIEAVTHKVHQTTAELALAVAGAGCSQPNEGEQAMSAPSIIGQLQQAVAAEDTVIESAIVLINGIAAQINTAIAAALAGGATGAQLAPLNNVVADITAQTTALANAVQANTPKTGP